MAKAAKAAELTNPEVKPPAAAKEPKPAKEKVERKVGGHALTAVITMGSNKEGIPYGPKNNPKRANSASADRFNLYKGGMTIEKTLAAGVTSGDILFDSDPKRKFIEITD
jgi:hypothetical protein